MRWGFALVVVVCGCAESVTAPSDVGPDAAIEDVGVDVGNDLGIDASLGCAPGTPRITSATAIQGSGPEWITAISPNPIDRTFAVAGRYAGDAFGVATAINGFDLSFRRGSSGTAITAVRTWTSPSYAAILDAFVDTHGSLTLVGTLSGPATVERSSVVVPVAGPFTGIVVRDVLGVAPAIATFTPTNGDVEITATSRRGDGYFFAGSFRGEVDFGSTHCTADGWDSFIAALTLEGTYDWVRCFGGPDEQRVLGIAMHDAGDAYVVGTFLHTIDIGASVPAQSSPGPMNQGFVARFDANGLPHWLVVVSASGLRGAGLRRVVVEGSYVLAVGGVDGPTGLAPEDPPLGGLDGALVVLDLLTGDVVRVVRIGGPSDDLLSDIAVDRCGRAWIVGTGDAPLIHAIDARTLIVGENLLGAPLGGDVHSLAVGASVDGDQVVVGGQYGNTPTIAGTTLPMSQGHGSDLVLITIEPR